MERSPFDAAQIEDVILGSTNQAGEDSRNVARFAALLAGLPVTVPGQTVNRLCASGLAAILDAARAITCGEGELFVIGGGMGTDAHLVAALAMGADGIIMRALGNETTDKVQKIERIHGGNLDMLMPHISGAIGRKAYETGDTSTGALAVGQAVSFADRIEPLAEIVKRLEDEAHQAMQRLKTLYQS